MKKLILLLIIFFLFGCAGKEGPMGPTGPQGQRGPSGPTGPSSPGLVLIKTYSGYFSTSGNYSLNVPEILNKQNSTIVLGFYAFPTSPSVWIPLTDGWLDSSQSQIFSISWVLGTILFMDMAAGNLYLVQIYEIQ